MKRKRQTRRRCLPRSNRVGVKIKKTFKNNVSKVIRKDKNKRKRTNAK